MTYTGGDYRAPQPWTGWQPAAEARLRALWSAGQSARQIAAALGCNRNMVIGKAHRLGLSGRPSPIIRPPRLVRVPELGQHDCRFPHGHVGDADFRFCARPQQAGSSYCAEHERLTRIPGSSYIEMERARKRRPSPR